jgi:Dof domain, zinc finger
VSVAASNASAGAVLRAWLACMQMPSPLATNDVSHYTAAGPDASQAGAGPVGNANDSTKQGGGRGSLVAKPRLPRPEGPAPPCPRCNAGPESTKFCYYNNRNIQQPRFYCRVRAHASMPMQGHAPKLEWTASWRHQSCKQSQPCMHASRTSRWSKPHKRNSELSATLWCSPAECTLHLERV